MIVTRKCVQCKEPQTMDLPDNGIAMYEKGALVQDAFPTLTADQREFFILTGLCDKCWKKIMGEEE